MLLVVMVAGYVIGSIPMGYVLVRVISGQDVRMIGSGRTGGTNAMRAAGLAAGLLTALLDLLKGAAGVWLAQWLMPLQSEPLAMSLAGLCAILGHNYSVFLKFKGGAGGAPTVGAAMALYPWSIFVMLPVGLVVLFGVGYASIATLSVAVVATVLFAYRYYVIQAPLEFVLFGVGAVILLAWALRPNIGRLLRGEERQVRWRARRSK